jgi:hypothetical protein
MKTSKVIFARLFRGIILFKLDPISHLMIVKMQGQIFVMPYYRYFVNFPFDFLNQYVSYQVSVEKIQMIAYP